ncbi:hypothetical protein R51_29280 [Bacillus safensis]|nr:hypothetical protein B33_00310 [Bacillus safensis]GLF87883.1 hypothetical protein R51_29280 [Bacillus safensis]
MSPTKYHPRNTQLTLYTKPPLYFFQIQESIHASSIEKKTRSINKQCASYFHLGTHQKSLLTYFN